MIEIIGELSLHDEIYNVIGCLEYLASCVESYKEGYNPTSTIYITEIDSVLDDTKKSLEFLTEFDLALKKASETGQPIVIEP